MSYSIKTIEGIGPVNKTKLAKVGIRTTSTLLERCGHPSGRKRVARVAGVDEKQLLRWTNMADLMRIRGVAEEYSELLEVAGVDTVKELRNRNPENLAERMADLNARRRVVRRTPSLGQVRSWVQQAGGLEPAIQH